MLGDGEPRTGSYESGTGRDVVGAGRVAARSDNINRVSGCRHPQHPLAHHLDGPGDFIHGFAAHTKRHEEARNLRWRGLTGHEHVEGRFCLLPRERLAVGGLGDQGFELAHRFTPARSRKLRRTSWPCSDAMLSGWNCTPCTFLDLCCSPMMSPSVSAVTSSSLGRVALSTTSE